MEKKVLREVVKYLRQDKVKIECDKNMVSGISKL